MSRVRLILVFLGLCLTGSLTWAAPFPSQVLPIVMKRPYQTYQRYQRLLPAQPTVTVRSTMKQLVIEQRQGKGWKTISTQPLTFAGPETSKTVTLTLPPKVPLSQLRVVAYNRVPEALREAKIFEYTECGGYYWHWNYATIDLLQPRTGLFLSDVAFTNNTLLATATTNFAVGTTNAVIGTGKVGPTSDSTSAPAAAVESDIWQISGKRLFFFNQYRGLQVIDLTDPAAPVRTGGLRLAASGDQMYVLDEAGTSVALLGRSTAAETANQQALFLIRITAGGVPELLHEIPLAQNVIDSRLIGKKLYLLQRQNNFLVTTFTINASLETFDLTNPAAPVRLSKLEMTDGSSLQAAGQYLLVGTGAMGLHLINTDTASGAPVIVKTFALKGTVQDKFKMGIANGAVVAITKTVNETWVETYPLEGSGTAPLARIELVGARNETLYATRFDADRVYVVTFRRIDPLFVVDLVDPAAPVVRGILEIPGWSTYLQPMGDRLLAIGLEWGLPTVSLFDVADPAAPSLLSRLTLGNGNYVNSEATWDEKAVEFFPEEGLVLVPYSGWGGTGTVSAMQAVQVGRDTLTLGATIPHKGVARRGAVVGDHFVSISGQELVVVNRTESKEGVDAELSLSWRVDYVVPFGDYLLQIEDGGGPDYYNPAGKEAKLRVSHRYDPDALVEEMLAGPGPILGVSQKGQRVFVAQRVEDAKSGQRSLRTWVLDLSAPPAVAQVTSVEHPLEQTYPSKVEGHWVNDSTLVWYVPLMPRSNYGGIIRSPIITIGTPIFTIQPVIQPGTLIINNNTGFTANTNLALSNSIAQPPPEILPTTPPEPVPVTVSLVCPVLNATAAPAAGALIKIGSEKAFRCGQSALVKNGCLFTSYEESLPYTGMQLLMYGTWYRTVRPWMQVVDFNASPATVRAPVSIQGELLNITQPDGQEALLFTQRQESTEGADHAVHALTYDGVAAYELDGTNVAASSLTGYAVDGHRFYFIRNGTPGIVGLGFDVALSKFTPLGTWDTNSYPSLLRVVDSYLLASSYSSLETAIIESQGGLTPAGIFDHVPYLLLGIDRLAPTEQGLLIPAYDYGVEFLRWSDFDEK